VLKKCDIINEWPFKVSNSQMVLQPTYPYLIVIYRDLLSFMVIFCAIWSIDCKVVLNLT